MSYAPNDLISVRARMMAVTGLGPVSMGIVGDAAHDGGYHCGNDRTIDDDYSVVESWRDSNGLSGAASAIDIGDFSVLYAGKRVTLRSLSIALVQACQRNDPRTEAIREIIYTPDGYNVSRWDKLGVRSGGDDSHLSHTHISFFRDSEGRRNGMNNFLGLFESIVGGTVSQPIPGSYDDYFPDTVMAVLDGTTPRFGYVESTGPSWDNATVTKYNVKAVEARLQAKLDQIIAAQAAGVLTPAQVAVVADKVAAAVAARPDNPLGDADKPAIRAAVTEAFKALVS